MKNLIFLLAIISSSQAVTLHCNFTDTVQINLPFAYTCYMPIVTITNHTEYLTEVTGDHIFGRSNEDVDLLYILHAVDLTFVPRGIENHFPNLIGIYIRECGVKTLRGDELHPFADMEWVSFRLNPNLQRIPGNFFEQTPKVHTIFFYDNDIRHVGENLLDSLENLRYVNFVWNYCIDMVGNGTAQIQLVIDALKRDCEDIIETTTPRPICGAFEDIICEIQGQNHKIIGSNEEILDDLKEISGIKSEVNLKIDENLQKSDAMNIKVFNSSTTVENLIYINLAKKTDLENLIEAQNEMSDKLEEVSENYVDIKRMLNETLDILSNACQSTTTLSTSTSYTITAEEVTTTSI